jgi:putative FmdB family regulatory protein
MPLYEYLCSKCGEKFEVIQKFSDAPLTVHEACGGSLEKLTSAPAFHLKGSGWYATDYAKSGSSSQKKDSDKKDADTKAESKSTDSKPAESKSSETKSSETKTESKPAASTTTKTD